MLAAPLALCLFLTTVVLALLTRAAPQLNLFSVGFPLRVIVCLGALLLAAAATVSGMVAVCLATYFDRPSLQDCEGEAHGGRSTISESKTEPPSAGAGAKQADEQGQFAHQPGADFRRRARSSASAACCSRATRWAAACSTQTRLDLAPLPWSNLSD